MTSDAPATTGPVVDPRHRAEMLDVLVRRYGVGGSWRQRLRYAHKRWAWIVVTVGARTFKRSLDIFVASSMLILLAPLFAVVATAVRLTDGGSILYWQSRVGKWGAEMAFPKFRSMYVDADARQAALSEQNDHGDAEVTFKMKNDPRVTPVGRIIRRLSIDELPQLWNVLIGEMSLVGPRPPLPKEVARYTLSDRRRLDVTPGLTCIWQVSGRGDIPFDRQVELDVEYIESRSFWQDIKILLLTVPAVLTGRGAY